MHDDENKAVNYYWDLALQRHRYYDGHSVEWLRNTANQLALVNSLGATVSIALAAGMQAPLFLLPGFAFFIGAVLVMLATFFAHRSNEKYSDEIKARIEELAEKVSANAPDALAYARTRLKADAFTGNLDHKLATRLAWLSLACIAIGAILLLPIVLCANGQ